MSGGWASLGHLSLRVRRLLPLGHLHPRSRQDRTPGPAAASPGVSGAGGGDHWPGEGLQKIRGAALHPPLAGPHSALGSVVPVPQTRLHREASPKESEENGNTKAFRKLFLAAEALPESRGKGPQAPSSITLRCWSVPKSTQLVCTQNHPDLSYPPRFRGTNTPAC